ncbi:uncharacterized protein LOC120665843 [Panicum virgatum]|uniref:uncharacterized protein LOC120665843 n=1 Tax=Panicum virgatum TaxID=38727 RepID=UPI0019D599F5|nr:uncharacterized protein LOC120665843 [Panicum virgatum]
MERRFFLQSEEGIHWRSAEGEILPSPGELVERAAGLRVIKRIFLDQLSVPYVPTIFRASNPPPEADVGVYRSDAPIPGSVAIEGQNVFHWPGTTRMFDAR